MNDSEYFNNETLTFRVHNWVDIHFSSWLHIVNQMTVESPGEQLVLLAASCADIRGLVTLSEQ